MFQSATKSLRTFITINPLSISEPFSLNTKVTLYKALIRSIMTYAYPAWEFTADSHLLKLERPGNKILLTIGNFSRRPPTLCLDVAFKIPYMKGKVVPVLN
jgi:hypothetical protein